MYFTNYHSDVYKAITQENSALKILGGKSPYTGI